MFKKIALVAALAVIGSGSAMASVVATTDTILSSIPDQINFYGSESIAGSFTDQLNFGVSLPGNLTSKVVNFNFGNATNIIGLTGSVYDLSNNLIYSFNDGVGATTALASGFYTLKISGTAVGTSSTTGFYAGALSLNPAAAVPEPETYAMFLAGLGIMGAVARRRFSKA